MTPEKKQLDDLFQRVTTDTPSLERDELRIMLEQHASGNLPVIPSQASIITKDRRGGFRNKGLFIMTIAAIAITAFLLFRPSSEPVSEKAETLHHEQSFETKSQVKIEEHKPLSIPKKEEAIVASTSKENFPVPSIAPVPVIELNDDALLKLGIIRRDNGDVFCYQRLSVRSVFEMLFRRDLWGVNAGIRAKSHCELGDNIPSFIPEHVTNLNGTARVSASGPDSAHALIFDRLSSKELERVDEIHVMEQQTPIPDISSKLTSDDMLLIRKLTEMQNEIPASHIQQQHHDANELIPILVRKNSVTDGKEKQDGLIFWYAPNPALLDLIKAAGVQQHRSDDAGFCTNVSLNPNPAASKSTLHYTLSGESRVNISLFEITGKKIRTLNTDNPSVNGQHDIDIATTDLTNGIYLVVISSDNGRRSIHRLVIEK